MLLTVSALLREVAVVAHAHYDGVVLVVLRGTPEGGDVASQSKVEEKAVHLVSSSLASRKRREAVGILVGDAAIGRPASPGLEFSARREKIAHRSDQGFPFRPARQVPTSRAYTLHDVRAKVTAVAAATLFLELAYGSSPRVKATVLGAIANIVIVAGTTVLRFIIQILSHPPLITDFYRLVPMAVAGIHQGPVFNET